MKKRRIPRTKIYYLYEHGYKIWRIAKEFGLSEDDVLEVLVDAGYIPIGMMEARKAGNNR